MGNRISISFRNGDKESPVLFSHWGGPSFYYSVLKYTIELIDERRDDHTLPLDRLEPGTVMVDFIRYYTEGDSRVESNLYIEKKETMGDNSDNGHMVIDLGEMSEMSDLEMRFEDVLGNL